MLKTTFSKLPSKPIQFEYRGYNSFVAKDFLEHTQLEIADFIKKPEQNDGFRYGLAGVEAFSLYGWLVPMKTRQPHDISNAFKEIMKVIGVPKTIFSDMDGVDVIYRILLEY